MKVPNRASKIIGVAVVILASGLFVFAVAQRRPDKAEINLDGFAQCLTDKGYVMYGAYWCPHCKNEKKGFGPSAWERVTYVECTDESKRCMEAGITGYPTWIAPGGVRLEGEQGVERLSHASGCSFSGTLPLFPEGSEEK